ncbi:U32 family peptidase [Desulfoprunum benzoelyticum]|nr:U32 family peptidase [Desulfoprunum benzoelyticum]MBM9530928.1 U32 family peptidase [Desulfoprunum benzoelyticum]
MDPEKSPFPSHPVELLAPARDLDCGIAAIDHGADAVYIGAPRYSARAAAGNDLAVIERLARYAHRYFARVYVALNTLLTDAELQEAAALAHDVWNAGADALIIQDMGLLECDLPPIALHASTQTDNRTVDKVRFLQQVGFSQVVLARELSLAEIGAIRAATTIPLECFVHGALCVCYSGRCYISDKVLGRSANRGECAQFCRHRYSLRDGSGKKLGRDRYFLSLKDLDLSQHLRELLAAGVSSFKIEGRLKDERYVKNVTAAYRLILDRLLEADGDRRRSSSGRCRFDFVPDPIRTFSRSGTDYFLVDRRNRPGSIDSPKATGQPVGTVDKVERQYFTIDTEMEINNGDGLCFFDRQGTLVGMKANRVEGSRIYPQEMAAIEPGTRIYRNFDSAFTRRLAASRDCRKIGIDLRVEETATGLRCVVFDEDGCTTTVAMPLEKIAAIAPGRIDEVVRRQMGKSGGTVFSVRHVAVAVDSSIHVPAAALNDLRRTALASHVETRLARHQRPTRKKEVGTAVWPAAETASLANITNERARCFYRRHGVTTFPPSAAALEMADDAPLMTCRYCLKRQLGICPKDNKDNAEIPEPLTLCDNTGCYELRFDCGRCEMLVLQSKKASP